MIIRVAAYESGSRKPWGDILIDTEKLPQVFSLEDGRVTAKVVAPVKRATNSASLAIALLEECVDKSLRCMSWPLEPVGCTCLRCKVKEFLAAQQQAGG
jgi:hypothetical protein